MWKAWGRCGSSFRGLPLARRISFFKRSKPAEPEENLYLEDRVGASSKLPGKVLEVDDDVLPVPRSTDFDAEALAARGFLRNYKPYRPPSGISTKLNHICTEHYGTNVSGQQNLGPVETKYKFLLACGEAFNHSVPNSMLHKMNTVSEVEAFYRKAVEVRNPLEMTRDMDLPPNLHVMVEPQRFHPQTDTMFGGISAFPKSSTIITGLKAKKKYAGYKWKKTP